jgi:pimeloyl-ACP methyl ester carboxylesterase
MILTYNLKTSGTLVISMLCMFFLSTDVVHSQVNKLDEKNLEETMRNPWKADRSAFLTDWLILGSIPISGMTDIDKDFLAGQKGEANVRPTEGATVTIAGSALQWVPVKTKDMVDLSNLFQGGRSEDAIAYAYTTISRKQAGKIYLSMGTDDGVKVWLNGKMVHRLAVLRALTFDEDGLVADVNAGENRLLLKIQQGKGGWGFVVRMLENPNELNVITGNIDFSVDPGPTKDHTLTVTSLGNLDQALMKQTVQMEVYTTGGKTVAKKSFVCAEPVILSHKDWPDGVYEFRFRYDDIRGATSFKYATWYKGDLVAAARELVKSAPAKEVRTPEAATHRMLSDMILDRLGSNLDNPDSAKLASLHSPLMEFAETKENSQVRPGGFVRLAYIDDVDNTPQFCRCYLPIDYDPSARWPVVVYLHGYNGDNPEYIRWWSVDKRHDLTSDKHNAIFIEPHGRGNTQYLGMGDRDVLKCIEMAKQRFSVDGDRVYLTGASMGGFGTWNVATRHPELFAAIAPIYGGGDYHVYVPKEKSAKLSSWEAYVNDKTSSTAQLEGLLNMPILVSHGDQDQSVDVNLSRYLVRLLQRWDYDVRYIEVPGKGHTELGNWDQMISWLLQHKRNAFPRQVRLRAADLRSASAYWVAATQKADPFEFMVVDAEALEGNVIRVDSKNVQELVLTPNEALIDRTKPVMVVWNGRRISLNNLQTKEMVLKGDDYKPLSSRKTPHLAGPINDFQNTPFVIVVGTLSKDPMMKRAIAEKAAAVTNGWKSFQKYDPRVMNDVDVAPADMKQYSLYLIGGPGENTVSKLVLEKIPFRIDSGSVVIDGKTFQAKDAVLHAIYPNPFNAERYVNIVAGTSGAGLSFYDPNRRGLFEYDYYVADGRLPNYGAGAKDEKIMVASGFFNHNWKLDNAFLKPGDEKLRSKCAYAVVNSDFSINIVSTARPSTALMKSYAGTYQVQGGPLVTISLDHDTLRAIQGPNSQFSAKLLATSDNEFFVREANASLSFRKDETTNDYVMVVYQLGQEYTSKKVK